MSWSRLLWPSSNKSEQNMDFARIALPHPLQGRKAKRVDVEKKLNENLPPKSHRSTVWLSKWRNFPRFCIKNMSTSAYFSRTLSPHCCAIPYGHRNSSNLINPSHEELYGLQYLKVDQSLMFFFHLL